MSQFKVLSTNHVGLVVDDLDGFINMMTGLFDYHVLHRGTRDVAVQSRVTNHPDSIVDIAYIEGGGFVLEVLSYAQCLGVKSYRPRPVDVGHWHLSINIDDIVSICDEVKDYGLTEVGELITVNAGPNQGNRIVYVATKEGVVIELIQKKRLE